jgi:hypothetical protein
MTSELLQAALGFAFGLSSLILRCKTASWRRCATPKICDKNSQHAWSSSTLPRKSVDVERGIAALVYPTILGSINALLQKSRIDVQCCTVQQ